MSSMKNVARYLEMRSAMPMPQLGDIVHAVNTGTEWEGELLLSDLRAVMASHDRLVEALRLAVDLVDRDVIRVRPSEREEFLAALTKWNAALEGL